MSDVRGAILDTVWDAIAGPADRLGQDRTGVVRQVGLGAQRLERELGNQRPQTADRQVFGAPPEPQAAPPGQAAGQSSTPPQPLPMRPQYWPPAVPLGLQVMGVQLVAAHTPGMLPPQVDPAGQSPHTSAHPQPSPMVPQ